MKKFLVSTTLIGCLNAAEYQDIDIQRYYDDPKQILFLSSDKARYVVDRVREYCSYQEAFFEHARQRTLVSCQLMEIGTSEGQACVDLMQWYLSQLQFLMESKEQCKDQVMKFSLSIGTQLNELVYCLEKKDLELQALMIPVNSKLDSWFCFSRSYYQAQLANYQEEQKQVVFFKKLFKKQLEEVSNFLKLWQQVLQEGTSGYLMLQSNLFAYIDSINFSLVDESLHQRSMVRDGHALASVNAVQEYTEGSAILLRANIDDLRSINACLAEERLFGNASHSSAVLQMKRMIETEVEAQHEYINKLLLFLVEISQIVIPSDEAKQRIIQCSLMNAKIKDSMIFSQESILYFVQDQTESLKNDLQKIEITHQEVQIFF